MPLFYTTTDCYKLLVLFLLAGACIYVSLFGEGGDSVAGIRTHPPTSWLSRGVWSRDGERGPITGIGACCHASWLSRGVWS